MPSTPSIYWVIIHFSAPCQLHSDQAVTTKSGVWLTVPNSSKGLLEACFVEIARCKECSP